VRGLIDLSPPDHTLQCLYTDVTVYRLLLYRN